MSVQASELRNRWAGSAAILVIGVLAALAVVLTARDLASMKSAREARAATADAVSVVGDAIRTALDDSASGTTTGSRQVTLRDAGTAGVSVDAATQTRDLGKPVLEDSGHGVVVVATYDTPSPPMTVEGRRAHVTGLRVTPLALGPTLAGLRPGHGGLSLAGPDRVVESLPGPRPSNEASYAVSLAADTAPDWTLTTWTRSEPLSASTWLAALGILFASLMFAVWLLRRGDRARRSQRELQRLQETSSITAALATVAQHSLDLADLLPALTTELASALDLEGLSLGAPSADGERRFFTWGATPADVPPSTGLPTQVLAGQSLCLVLARGGRTVARLRIVAGRDLDRHDLNALGSATEVLTSTLANAEAFAQQRELLQRMRSVDELKTVFLATASHELRTPVGVITGYAQLIASSWESLSPDEARMYAEQVDSNAQRLGSLVEDLLDFSRLERGVGLSAGDELLDLGAVADQILDEQPDLAPDHRVVRQTSHGLGVTGSPQAVERVLTNLVGNAAKYSPAGTTIRVSVKQHRDRVELVVDDEGPGVPVAEREQVFSRFFRGRGDSVIATRGAGLGLAIVSEFAASMGGQVSVTSADSGGARFVVSYPLTRTPESALEGASDVHT